MKTFWKFIVFTGLLFQFSFAYSANHDATISFQKQSNTEFGKETISVSHFVQPSFDKESPELKQNNRIPVGLSDITLLPLFSSFRENNLKIVLLKQDIDRCTEVSILLFPFHYFW
jgi:hypothetical protein